MIITSQFCNVNIILSPLQAARESRDCPRVTLV